MKNEYFARKMAESRARFKEQGICIRCKKNPIAADNENLCVECREREKEKRNNHTAEGLCIYCSYPTIPGKTMCKFHADREKKRHRVLYMKKVLPRKLLRKLSNEVLAALSEKQDAWEFIAQAIREKLERE